MDQEKHGEASYTPIEVNNTEKSYVLVDLRKILLGTIISAVVNLIIIGISFNVESAFLKRFVLPGAQYMLENTKTVSHIVAVFSVISEFKIASFSFISQDGSSTAARALIVAVLLTFINGSLQRNVFHAVMKEIMLQMAPVEA